MKKLSYFLFLSLLISFFSSAAFAQEKNQAYYNRHESEIFPDAQSAFQNADYLRAEELCKWHYIIVGDRSADNLRDMARRCSKLSEEIKEFLAAGDIASAKKASEALLELNPKDPEANRVIEIQEVEEAQEEVVSPPDNELPKEEIPDIIADPVEESVDPQTIPNPDPESEIPQITSSPKRMNSVAVKARISVLDVTIFAKSIAPGLAAGVYDIAGSRLGTEIGVFYGPVISSGSKLPLWGADMSVLFRAADNIYPKVFSGVFSCSGNNYSPTRGMYVGAGVSFVLARHLCLDAGLSFFPAVFLNGVETVSGSGFEYDFPSAQKVLSAGVSPSVSIGWLF